MKLTKLFLGLLQYYTLQNSKSGLPSGSPTEFVNPDQLDYSPVQPHRRSGTNHGTEYSQLSLCHRHRDSSMTNRNYETMPRMIETTSGYCSSSNSSNSQKTPRANQTHQGTLPRSISFQPARRKNTKSEGVLV